MLTKYKSLDEIPEAKDGAEAIARRKELVAALRSGEYSQTQCALWRPEADENYPAGMCCQGVGGRLIVDESLWVDFDSYGITYKGIVSFEKNREYIYYHYWPKQVARFFGMTASQSSELAIANDDGKNFSAIADMIEEMSFDAWRFTSDEHVVYYTPAVHKVAY